MSGIIYNFRGKYKQYHSSIKLFIAGGGNPVLAYDLNVPRSTVSSWKYSNLSKLITHPLTGSANNDLLLFTKFIENRCAIRLFAVYVSVSETFHHILHSAAPDFNKVLNDSKDTLLNTIATVKKTIGLDRTLKLLRISRQRYDMWRKNKSCSASPLGLCVKTHPLQIAHKEVNRLRMFLETIHVRHWPLNSIYFQGLREQRFAFSLTTFYKYADILGFGCFLPDTRRKNHCRGLRAVKPDQYWHADVTIFKPLDNVKVYIYLVIDSFSRYILSWRASTELSAVIRFDTVIEAYRQFVGATPSAPVGLIVDGGSENNSIPLHPTDELSVRKIIAQQDIIFSNSMIEALNKQLKYRYLFQKDLPDFNAVVKHLEISIPDFNNIRPYSPLHGLTPAEVYLKGMLPDKNRFKEQIKKAREQRYIENTSKPCPLCAV